MSPFYTNVAKHGNNILYSGYDESGIRVREKIRFAPEMFVQSSDPQSVWKSIHGEPLESMTFDSMSEAREFMERYASVPDYKIHGMDRWIFQFIQRKFPGEIKFERDRINILNIDIETYSGNGFPDPEDAKEAITLITLKSNKSETRHVFGCGDYDPMQSEHEYREKIVYHKFTDEESMLRAFIIWFSEPSNCPDIITGWNIRAYDIPYIVNRLVRLFGEEEARRLSPWRKIEAKLLKDRLSGQDISTYDIIGIAQLDYLLLFKKFGNQGPQESYKLDNIASVVLGDAKVSYSDEYDSLHDLYVRNFQKYVDYGVKDTELIDDMEKKLGILTLAISFAYFAGINYTDTLGTTGLWDAIIFRDLASKHIAVPPGSGAEEENTGFAGGFVKEPQIGKYDWVCSLDLNSLYPSLIVQYNMSPETLIEDVRGEIDLAKVAKDLSAINIPASGASMAANGICFRNDKQGYLPAIISSMYADRVTAKNKMIQAKKKLELLLLSADSDSVELKKQIAEVETEISHHSNRQMALKLALNSAYGALANKFFRYYDLRIAEAVTLTGQLTIQVTSDTINEHLNKTLKSSNVDYVLMNDTDSATVNMKGVVEKYKPNHPAKFLAEYMNKSIIPTLAKSYSRLGTALNMFENRMVIKLESVASSALFLAKKKYAMYVISSEGVEYKEPKIKMVGISAIQSSTPGVCRAEMKETIKLILTGTEKEVQDKIAAFREKFDQFTVEQIAFPRGVNNLEKYEDSRTIYISSRTHGKGAVVTPIQARASLLFNHQIKQNGLDKKYTAIRSGDKIRYVFLKIPNPIREDVIGFIDTFPKELSLEPYVDRETQFEKAFLPLITQMLKVAGWKVREIGTLDEFFS